MVSLYLLGTNQLTHHIALLFSVTSWTPIGVGPIVLTVVRPMKLVFSKVCLNDALAEELFTLGGFAFFTWFALYTRENAMF
jgi:hypothetical protein